MINLYVKFNGHSSYAKQVIVLKVADRQADGWTKFWLRPKNYITMLNLY